MLFYCSIVTRLVELKELALQDSVVGTMAMEFASF
jgi:hypothetical protein